MRFWKAGLLLVVMLLFSTNGFTQKRNNQFEIFIGGAVPLSPEWVKNTFEIGASIHGQYVMFLSPRIGLSLGLAGEGFTVDSEINDFYGYDTQLAVGELGVGLRYYVTPMESNIQMYLFGMGTYNIVIYKGVHSFYDPISGIFLYEDEGETKEKKPGVAFGGGFEIPAGESFNLLFQGLVRVMFVDFLKVEDENDYFSFIGVTAGLAF